MHAIQFFNEALEYKGDNCLLWPFAKTEWGYGKLGNKRVNRQICIKSKGPPPTKKHQAAHTCGVKICCNPKHIRWATRSENEMDKVAHGTSNRGVKNTHCKLSENAVKEIRTFQGNLSSYAVGRLFDIRGSHVRRIWNRQSWDWLE